jgi:trk system potassium uptake protein TrkA
MKVIVMGCGRIGSQVSQLLSEQGHAVTIIDHDSNSKGRLGPNFKGRIIPGLGFDRNVLIRAGIEQVEAFVLPAISFMFRAS